MLLADPSAQVPSTFSSPQHRKKEKKLKPPEKVTNPSPTQGATDVPVTTNISWNTAARALSYDVYFGKNATQVANANTSSSCYLGNVPINFIDPVVGGNLDYNTTYYWRVDSRNSKGVTKGALWGFTT
ncbi:MAG: hypothetical protein N2234_08070, partial [Planctomycetota bacterium]|nr:hypothetical protein [Planctomycetota bacterium]